MRPSHRLDVLLVPADADHAPVPELREFLSELVRDGVIDGGGRPGPRSDRWMAAGFRGLRLDTPDRITLYANRQGGFRVLCPTRDLPITEAFSRALTAARGSDRPDRATLACPICERPHTLAETIGRPAFRFARLALQTIDAEALRPEPPMEDRLRQLIGDIGWVGVRT